MAPPGAVAAADCLRRIDVRGLDDAARQACISEQAQAAAGRLAPAAGVMLQAVWFDAGAEAAGRLLLTIHHLAVDGVSWRILVPDLAAAWEAIASGEEPALAPRGTSFRRWAQRLAAEAQDAERCRRACVLERHAERSRRCRWSTARSIRTATSAARPGISRSRCRLRSPARC